MKHPTIEIRDFLINTPRGDGRFLINTPLQRGVCPVRAFFNPFKGLRRFSLSPAEGERAGVRGQNGRGVKMRAPQPNCFILSTLNFKL